MHELFDKALLQAVNELPEGLSPLQVSKRLGAFSPGARQAGGELVELRQRARPKFSNAKNALLTRAGLEQSSSLSVARARAARFKAVGGLPADLTAGLGADAIALGEACGGVVASDIDPLITRLLLHNLQAHEIFGIVLRARAEQPATSAPLLHLDPDRRSASKARRQRSELGNWRPAWADIQSLISRFEGGDIKLHPLAQPEDVPQLRGVQQSWQWTSERGASKEATLWFGNLAEAAGEREALAIGPWGEARWSSVVEPPPEPVRDLEAAIPDWLATCDPALRRSNLHGALARAEGWRPLFAGATTYATPRAAPRGLWRPLRVIDASPADRRRVRAMLERHDVGPLEVRRDGVEESADRLAARLRGRGNRRGTLLIAGLASGHRAFLVEEPPAQGGA